MSGAKDTVIGNAFAKSVKSGSETLGEVVSVGAGTSLAAGANAIKSLVQGAGIGISGTMNEVTLTAATTLATGGSGPSTSVIHSTSTTAAHVTRGILAGAGASVSATANDVVIAGNTPLTTSAAGGVSVIATSSTTTAHVTRELVAAQGATVVSSHAGLGVTIGGDIQLASTGAATTLVAPATTNSSHVLKDLEQGAGMAFTADATKVSVAANVTLVSEGGGSSLVSSTSTTPAHRVRAVAGDAPVAVSVVGEVVHVAIQNSPTFTGNVNVSSGNLTTSSDLIAGTGIKAGPTAFNVYPADFTLLILQGGSAADGAPLVFTSQFKIGNFPFVDAVSNEIVFKHSTGGITAQFRGMLKFSGISTITSGYINLMDTTAGAAFPEIVLIPVRAGFSTTAAPVFIHLNELGAALTGAASFVNNSGSALSGVDVEMDLWRVG